MTASVDFIWPQEPISIFDRSVGKVAQLIRNICADSADCSKRSVVVDEPRQRATAALQIAFEEAREPNWDGEGAAPANLLSFKYAQAFLAARSPAIPKPDVYVDSDGELRLEWYGGPRSVFSVSIGADGTLTYAGLFGVYKTHGVEMFTESIPPDIERSILRARAPA